MLSIFSIEALCVSEILIAILFYHLVFKLSRNDEKFNMKKITSGYKICSAFWMIFVYKKHRMQFTKCFEFLIMLIWGLSIILYSCFAFSGSFLDIVLFLTAAEFVWNYAVEDFLDSSVERLYAITVFLLKIWHSKLITQLN